MTGFCSLGTPGTGFWRIHGDEVGLPGEMHPLGTPRSSLLLREAREVAGSAGGSVGERQFPRSQGLERREFPALQHPPGAVFYRTHGHDVWELA